MPVSSALPVRLGHLVPERHPVVISRTNPLWLALAEDDPRRDQTPELVDVVLQAYVFGPRCPGVIKAELASIEAAYMKALGEMSSQVSDVEAGAAPRDTSLFIVAWHTFLRETICVLVPGLTTAEADVLAAVAPGDEGPATDLLRMLGVWNTAGRPEDAPPEVVGEVSQPTMALSSPISPPSTDSDPSSS
jgi:hypothetical protein